MRTTLALDDELVAKAQAFTGLKTKSSLVREALKAVIERESARRLARLGVPTLSASVIVQGLSLDYRDCLPQTLPSWATNVSSQPTVTSSISRQTCLSPSTLCEGAR
jgi:Bacterial antitoxin of type II TA system, VapB